MQSHPRIGTQSNNIPQRSRHMPPICLRIHYNFQRQHLQRLNRHGANGLFFQSILKTASELLLPQFGLVLPLVHRKPIRDHTGGIWITERRGPIPDRELRQPHQVFK